MGLSAGEQASERRALLSPAEWSGTLSGPPVLDRRVPGMVPLLLRHWQGIEPRIDQVPLDHHYLSLHLGGAKRLRRSGEGATQVRDAEYGSHSVVPSGAAFQWDTEGPVDFAHFYFDRRVVGRAAEQAFGRDPSRVELREELGRGDPLMSSVATALMAEMCRDRPQQAFVDDLAHLLLLQLLRTSSNIGEQAFDGVLRIAPFRLRRAMDYFEEHVAAPIGVAEIADAAGVSPFHFSRAFKSSVGVPPYAFLLERRLHRAKALVGQCALSFSDIAAMCGFNGASQFSRAFRRHMGVTPTRYRNSL